MGRGSADESLLVIEKCERSTSANPRLCATPMRDPNARKRPGTGRNAWNSYRCTEHTNMSALPRNPASETTRMISMANLVSDNKGTNTGHCDCTSNSRPRSQLTHDLDANAIEPACLLFLLHPSSLRRPLDRNSSGISSTILLQAASDPRNPLLALRRHLVLSPIQTMDASKLLQLQTAAAYTLTRPKPQYIIGTNDTSVRTSSSSDSASSSETALPQIVCCSRCQCQSFSTEGMVCFALNSYYCTRCASLVGYGG